MSNNIVHHASKPIIAPSTLYDVSYTLTDTYQSRAVPAPGGLVSGINLLSQPMVVKDSGADVINSGRFYTTWSEGVVTLDIPDFPATTGSWYLRVGGTSICNLNGLPSGYRSSTYEIVSVDSMTSFGNWKRDLLYSMSAGGEYIPEGYALPLTNGGNRAYVEVVSTLRNLNTGDIITVTNNTIEYSATNGIYTTHMAAFYPASSFAGRDEVITQITMTETPQ